VLKKERTDGLVGGLVVIMQIIGDGYEQAASATTKKDLNGVEKHEDDNIESENVFFGDFSNGEYDKFFSIQNNAVQNSVQFLCDSYNATKTWVEEGQKHLLHFDPVDDELITFGEQSEHYESAPESDVSSFLDRSPQLVNGNRDLESKCDDHRETISKLDLNDEDAGAEETTQVNPPLNGHADEGTGSDETEETGLSTKDDPLVGNNLSKDVHAAENHVEENDETASKNEKIDSEQPQKKSWASLFRSSDETVVEGVPNGLPSIGPVKVEAPAAEVEVPVKEVVEEKSLSLIPMDTDERASKLAEFVSHWYPDYSRTHIQLHGLINRSNWCYINASLQALLAIPTIYHFFKSLKEFLNDNAKVTSTPLTDSMISFFNRFDPIEVIHTPGKRDSEELNYGAAYEPKGVYEVLSVMKSTLSEKGRQEDAEEFLSFLLNGIHDELVALSKLVQPKSKAPELTNGDVHDSESDDEDAWEEVGPKNKVRTTRKAVIEGSLIKHVFGGVICSSVLQTGVKESTTFQPFFTLQLDIQSENIQTLSNAIEFYFMKEKLQGFTCSKTKTEVEASRRISLEELPLMFIFHLKYFVFDRKGGSQKLHKEIEIPVDLEIPRDIISNSKVVALSNMRRYKLHAIVYHHGRHAAGGHYTAAVHHGSPCGWVHFDDNQIKTINMNENKHLEGSVPYLLFYERIQPR